MTTITISLPESLRDFVESQVKTRGYGNISEYFRGLLREAQQREEDKHLEALLLEGLDSGGDDINVNERFWKDLKSKATQLAAKHKKRACML